MNTNKGQFTVESFENSIITHKHYQLKLTNGKTRRLRRLFCERTFSLDEYHQLIIEKKTLGPFQFSNNYKEPFEAFLVWKFLPAKKEIGRGRTFLEGGECQFLYFYRHHKADPNTQEDVYEHRYSWRLPSVPKIINKNIYGLNLTLHDVLAIADKECPGLFVENLQSRGNTWIKWDHENKKVLLKSATDKPDSPNQKGLSSAGPSQMELFD